MAQKLVAIDKRFPDPEEQEIFSRLAFDFVGPRRVRCSHCGTDYYLQFYEGTLLNMFECGHHPDWYYLHALRFPDGTILIWECCKDRLLELDRLGQIPPELALPLGQKLLSYHDLVQARLDNVPQWQKQMHDDFFFYESGFSSHPREFSRQEDD